jgi:hypothetical protein
MLDLGPPAPTCDGLDCRRVTAAWSQGHIHQINDQVHQINDQAER